MYIKKTSATTLFLLFALLSSVCAAKSTQQTELNISLQEAKKQSSALKKQVSDIQKKMDELNQRQEELNRRINNNSSQSSTAKATVDNTHSELQQKHESSSGVFHDLFPDLSTMPASQIPYGTTLLANIGGTAVITSPFIHSRFDFRGSDLIVNYSSINKDTSALMQRRSFARQMKKMGLGIPSYPILELSGEIEAVAANFRDFSGDSGTTLDLTDAELDVQALINNWFTGYFSFVYDNTPPRVGGRVSKSSLFLDNGFITVGNFEKSPIYVTVGQIYVPFGQYDSYLLIGQLNSLLFRTKARALTLGYHSVEETGMFAAAYAFQGPTRAGRFAPGEKDRRRNTNINTYGFNLGYLYKVGALSGMVGISGITNVANSLGMQFTNGDTFTGFAESSSSEVLDHLVPGVDLRAELYYNDFTFIGEYTGTTRSFAPIDLTFNGHGAKPSTYHLEGAYTFDIFMRPSSVAIGYGHSSESLALNIPEDHYAITLNSSLWQNTLFSIEYRHGRNYGATDTASGDFGPTFMRPGKIVNAITIQLDTYF